MLNTKAIREREEKATPGPWYVEEGGEDEWYFSEGSYDIMPLALPLSVLKDGSKEDAEFIAHARTDIPDLLVQVERCREVLRWIAGAKLYGRYETAAKMMQEKAQTALRELTAVGPERDGVRDG